MPQLPERLRRLRGPAPAAPHLSHHRTRQRCTCSHLSAQTYGERSWVGRRAQLRTWQHWAKDEARRRRKQPLPPLAPPRIRRHPSRFQSLSLRRRWPHPPLLRRWHLLHRYRQLRRVHRLLLPHLQRPVPAQAATADVTAAAAVVVVIKVLAPFGLNLASGLRAKEATDSLSSTTCSCNTRSSSSNNSRRSSNTKPFPRLLRLPQRTWSLCWKTVSIAILAPASATALLLLITTAVPHWTAASALATGLPMPSFLLSLDFAMLITAPFLLCLRLVTVMQC